MRGIKFVISVQCEILCEMLWSDLTRKLSAIVLKYIICIKPPCVGMLSS